MKRDYFYQLGLETSRRGWVLGWLGIWGVGAAVAELPPAPEVVICPVAALTMPTVAGKVYQMQSSADLLAWVPEGGEIFGSGEAISEQRMAEETGRFYRWQVSTGPVLGLAPWQVAGASFQMNENGVVTRYDFMAGNKVVRQTGDGERETLACQWQRVGRDEGRAALGNYVPPGISAGILAAPETVEREVLDLVFSGTGVGQYRWEKTVGKKVARVGMGSFGPAATAAVAPENWVPRTVVGREIALCSQPNGGGLRFVSAAAGSRCLGGEVCNYSGTWSMRGVRAARLVATFLPGHREDYTFTFTGPGTGRFTRQTFTHWVLRDEDAGTFCLGAP